MAASSAGTTDTCDVVGMTHTVLPAAFLASKDGPGAVNVGCASYWVMRLELAADDPLAAGLVAAAAAEGLVAAVADGLPDVAEEDPPLELHALSTSAAATTAAPRMTRLSRVTLRRLPRCPTIVIPPFRGKFDT